MAHDVFISYSSKDKPIADAACAVLESRGIRCWTAPRDVTPGCEYADCIIDAINGSRLVVLIFSANANQSHHIRKEVERAVSRGIPILPFRIETVMPSKSLEYFISTPHWLDAIDPPLTTHLDRLTESTRSILASQGVAVGAAGAGVTPAEIPVAVRPKAGSRGRWVVAAVAAIAVGAALVFALPRFLPSQKAQRNPDPNPSVATNGPAAMGNVTPPRSPATNPTVSLPSTDIMAAQAKAPAAKVKLTTGEEKTDYAEGDTISFIVETDRDCYVTLLSKDNLGNVTLLLPNAYQPSAPLLRNTALTIPSEGSGFKMRVTPPHGTMEVKAIATSTPVLFNGVTPELLHSQKFASLGGAKSISLEAEPQIIATAELKLTTHR